MVAIAGGKPKQMGLIEILKYYCSYQRQVVLRRTKFELKEALERCHILEGLIIGVHNVDEVVKIIKTADSTADARRKLIERFALSERQAQAILDLRLARLAKLEVTKLENELAELKIKIDRLQKIVADKNLQLEIVKDEMREIKRKFKCERKSEIVDKIEDIKVKRTDIRRKVDRWAVALTAANTVKFVEEDDFVAGLKHKTANSVPSTQIHTQVLYCDNSADVYAFTNSGNCVKLNFEFIDPVEYKSTGVKIETLAELAKGEYAVKLLEIGKDEQGDLIIFTKSGAVKRSSIAEYVTCKKVVAAIKLKDGDELINVEKFDSDEFSTMTFVTKKGMCLNASKDDVPVQGRTAGGVKGISLSSGDEVVLALQQNGEGEIVIATTLGTFKRVVSSLIDVIGRACKGVMIADIKNKGEILFADYVTMPYNILIVNTDKTVAEINTEDISIESRVSKGKPLKIASVKEVSKVYAVKHKSSYSGGAVQMKF